MNPISSMWASRINMLEISLRPHRFRLAVYFLLAVILTSTGIAVTSLRAASSSAQVKVAQKAESLEKFAAFSVQYRLLVASIRTSSDQGVDVQVALANKEAIHHYLLAGNFSAMEPLLTKTALLLEEKVAEKKAADAAALKAEEERLKLEAEAAQQRIEDEQKSKGTVQGKVTSGGSALANVKVSLLRADGGTEGTVKSDANGAYSFWVLPATYSLVFELSGYTTARLSGVVLEPAQSVSKDQSLSKLPPSTPKPTPTPTPAPVTSTKYSSYSSKTIATSRGNFTIHLLTVDLGSGHVRVITDTAANGDCLDDCPAKSLKDYVNQHGGFAGINGTYFCPPDYADCQEKSNSFYWKIFNPRLNTMINANNQLGEQDPFLTFDSAGRPRYFSTWAEGVSAGGYYSGISCRPALVQGGQNILNESQLDNKQRTAKSNRGAIGIKGTTFYGVIAKSATVVDLAAIMSALEVDSALNIDGGGSSALYFSGAYKAGPGRALPNAIIFAEQ